MNRYGIRFQRVSILFPAKVVTISAHSAEDALTFCKVRLEASYGKDATNWPTIEAMVDMNAPESSEIWEERLSWAIGLGL